MSYVESINQERRDKVRPRRKAAPEGECCVQLTVAAFEPDCPEPRVFLRHMGPRCVSGHEEEIRFTPWFRNSARLPKRPGKVAA